MARIMMRQLAGAPERKGDLQETEAHQIGAERHAEEDDPARQLHVWPKMIGRVKLDYEFGAHGADDGREKSAAEQTEKDDLLAPLRLQHVDHDVDTDMDAGAHAIWCTDLRHPHEHVDAELLRPGQIDVVEERIKKRDAERVALHHRNKDH